MITARGIIPVQYGDEIPLFTLNLPAATAAYQRMCAIAEQYAEAIRAYYLKNHGVVLDNPARPFSTSSWSPEAEVEARQWGRKAPECIEVHSWYQEPEFVAALEAAGLATHIYVQKHDWWIGDRYRRMSDREQAEWDASAYESGFHLSGASLRRLVRYGIWSHARAKQYAPGYEGEK